VEKKGRGKGRSGHTEHRHPQHTESEKTKQRWHSVKTLAVNQSSGKLGVHTARTGQTLHLGVVVLQHCPKIERLWMVSGESGALCEAVPIELYCLHCNG